MEAGSSGQPQSGDYPSVARPAVHLSLGAGAILLWGVFVATAVTADIPHDTAMATLGVILLLSFGSIASYCLRHLVGQYRDVRSRVVEVSERMGRLEAASGLGGNGVPASTLAAVRRLEGRHGG